MNSCLHQSNKVKVNRLFIVAYKACNWRHSFLYTTGPQKQFKVHSVPTDCAGPRNWSLMSRVPGVAPGSSWLLVVHLTDWANRRVIIVQSAQTFFCSSCAFFRIPSSCTLVDARYPQSLVETVFSFEPMSRGEGNNSQRDADTGTDACNNLQAKTVGISFDWHHFGSH